MELLTGLFRYLSLFSQDFLQLSHLMAIMVLIVSTDHTQRLIVLIAVMSQSFSMIATEVSLYPLQVTFSLEP